MNPPGNPRTGTHSAPLPAALLLALVSVTRIPLLFNGYGSDPDAWRVASVARNLIETGEYGVSRFPGYPLHELVSAGLVALGGSLASNIGALLCGLVAVAVFRNLALRHLRYPRITTACFAFAPLFWINSATTMDYVWSLLFILLAVRMATNARATMSGIMMGIATGFRPSNFLMVIPVAILLLLVTRSGRRVMWMNVVAVATGIVAFLPVFSTYGVGGWMSQVGQQIGSFSPSMLDRTLFAGYRAAYAIGPFAAICIIVLVVFRRRVIVQLLHRREPLIIVSFAALVVSTLLFVAIPAERGYLLAALPFLLVLVDATATRSWMLGIAFAMISFSFVNPDVIEHTTFVGRPGFNVRGGMVLQEIDQKRGIFFRRGYLTSHPPPSPAIIMTGSGPVFWLENDQVAPVPGPATADPQDITVRLLSDRDIHFTPMLSRREVDSALASGTTVWCASDMQGYIESAAHYRMQDAHVGILSIPPYDR